jgi:hypothetical protein
MIAMLRRLMLMLLLLLLGCSNAPCASAAAEIPVVVFGVGAPKASIGWVHVRQLLDGDAGPHGRLTAVVSRSLYLTYTSQSATPDKSDEELEVVRAQARLLQELVAHRVQIFETGARARAAGALRPPQQRGGEGPAPLMAILAGRTGDREMSALEAMEGGATHLLLEAPGAADERTLRRLRGEATRRGVKLVVGYHQHVAPHVTDALVAINKLWAHDAVSGTASLLLEHNDNVGEGSRALERAFRADSEGLVRSIAAGSMHVWLRAGWAVATPSLAE